MDRNTNYKSVRPFYITLCSKTPQISSFLVLSGSPLPLSASLVQPLEKFSAMEQGSFLAMIHWRLISSLLFGQTRTETGYGVSKVCSHSALSPRYWFRLPYGGVRKVWAFPFGLRFPTSRTCSFHWNTLSPSHGAFWRCKVLTLENDHHWAGIFLLSLSSFNVVHQWYLFLLILSGVQ